MFLLIANGYFQVKLKNMDYLHRVGMIEGPRGKDSRIRVKTLKHQNFKVKSGARHYHKVSWATEQRISLPERENFKKESCPNLIEIRMQSKKGCTCPFVTIILKKRKGESRLWGGAPFYPCSCPDFIETLY